MRQEKWLCPVQRYVHCGGGPDISEMNPELQSASILPTIHLELLQGSVRNRVQNDVGTVSIARGSFRDFGLLGGSISASPRGIQSLAGSDPGFTSKLDRGLGGDGCSTGKPSRRNGSGHRDKAKERSPSGNPCLLVGEDGHCVGGVRRTSLLYQIVCSQAVLLFGLLAGYSATRAFPAPKVRDLRWQAIGTASAVIGLLFLVGGISGKLWLFGI